MAKKLDPVILSKMREATHPKGGLANCLDLLSDEQLVEMYYIMESRWRSGIDIFRYMARIIREDWQVFENPEHPTLRTLEQTVRKVFVRIFGEAKFLKRAKPKKLRTPEENKALDAMRKQKDRLRSKYDPVYEQIKFVDDLSEKVEFWEARARESGVEKDYVAKLLAIKGKALIDAVNMFQSLGLLDVKTQASMQAHINIESLKVFQNFENRDSLTNLLGTLKSRVSEIAEKRLPQSEVIDIEPEFSPEIDPQRESDLISPADNYRDTEPLADRPCEDFGVSEFSGD